MWWAIIYNQLSLDFRSRRATLFLPILIKITGFDGPIKQLKIVVYGDVTLHISSNNIHKNRKESWFNNRRKTTKELKKPIPHGHHSLSTEPLFTVKFWWYLIRLFYGINHDCARFLSMLLFILDAANCKGILLKIECEIWFLIGL